MQVLTIPAFLVNVDVELVRASVTVGRFSVTRAPKTPEAGMVIPGRCWIMITASIVPSLHQFAATS
jgi:hypothetical protein